jgi:peptidyl-prolyl cis-trans isomerase D
MTMLDRMRRHKNWLKWSLVLVCLAFVFFYVPDFFDEGGAGAAPRDVVAEVEGHRITAAQFQRVYQNQLQSYRSAYGDTVSEQLLKQMGIDQQILQQLIDEQAAMVEAHRLGIRVSDAEVRERIMSLPAFQENGQFFGEARYRQLLRMQRPPLTPSEFEESVRRSLLLDRLQATLTDWVTISDTDIEQEYRRRHEQVKLDIVSFEAEPFREQVTVEDAAIQAHFEANQEAYRVPEKRRVRFLLLDNQAMRAGVTISPDEVERFYEDNIDQYSTPEQVRARHILFSTEGRDEEVVRKQAEGVLAQARRGADFAELARRHSEDPGSAEEGGDLDYFGRGRMVPEFEEAAFSAEPGTITDLVQTQYGFHIIKVEDKRPETTNPLEEVREQITDRLAWERAGVRINDLAERLDREITRPADLDRVAAARGLTVQESEFFAPDEPIPGLGPAPEATRAAFELTHGQVSDAIRVPQGVVFLAVTGQQESRLPALDEVRDRLREDLIQRKAQEAALARARELRQALADASDFARAATEAEVEVQTTDLIARGAPLPGIGISTAVEATAFSLQEGQVSEPIATETGAVIVRLVEREAVTAEQIAEGRDDLRQQLLSERRSRFFSAYMTQAKQRMQIQIHRDTLRRII